MKVLITGATGLVGQKLALEFFKNDYDLVVVGRSLEEDFRKKFFLPCQYITWESLSTSQEILEKVDVVCHLAGDNIADGRWTARKMKSILLSRTEPTKKLVSILNDLKTKPSLVIGVSAIGYYGDTGQQEVSEDSQQGGGFLSEVCELWERAMRPAADFTRVVHLRVGVVLSEQGGFLEEMAKVFSTGMGGVIGSGDQWMSCISLADLVRVFSFLVEKQEISGVVNAVMPQPLQNKDFSQLLAQCHYTGLGPKIPEAALKLLLGKKSELALFSQRVKPQVLLDQGFEFEHPSMKEALEHEYLWKTQKSEERFYRYQWVPEKLERVFDFFSQPENLETITPPHLSFQIISKSAEKMGEGLLIDYKLKIHGVPAKWRTLISKWNPPHQFVDEQLKGPYKKWHHTHSFETLRNGTLLQDEVIYLLPFGVVGKTLSSAWVKKDVESIFAFRTERIGELFKR